MLFLLGSEAELPPNLAPHMIRYRLRYPRNVHEHERALVSFLLAFAPMRSAPIESSDAIRYSFVDIELLLSKHKADAMKPAMQSVAGVWYLGIQIELIPYKQ